MTTEHLGHRRRTGAHNSVRSPNPEPAVALHLSVKTIESHVSSVVRKLQLSNRHQLTAWANERRIV